MESLQEENYPEESFRLYEIDDNLNAVEVICATKGSKLLLYNQKRIINQEHFKKLEEKVPFESV